MYSDTPKYYFRFKSRSGYLTLPVWLPTRNNSDIWIIKFTVKTYFVGFFHVSISGTHLRYPTPDSVDGKLSGNVYSPAIRMGVMICGAIVPVKMYPMPHEP
jgi:hypothetical protein